MRTLILSFVFLFGALSSAFAAVDCGGAHNTFTCSQLGSACKWMPLPDPGKCVANVGDTRCSRYTTQNQCLQSRINQPSWNCNWDSASNTCK